MAPEMFRAGHCGPQVDMYSLGCLLIELFGRKRVWPGLDAPDIMVRIMGTYETPPQMPDTSHLKAPFSTICQQLCQLDATRRPKSGETLKMLMEITVVLY